MNDIIEVQAREIKEEEAQRWKRELPKYWDAQKINSVIESVENIMHRTLFFTMWRTGLRVSEVISIEKQDLDFKEYLIQAKHLKSRKYKYRTIPMHPELRNVLATYCANLKYNDRLFPITRQQVHNLAKKYFQGHPHMFRHSFAINWLKNGQDIYLLKEMLGHSTIKTTEEYLKIMPRHLGAELLKVKFE